MASAAPRVFDIRGEIELRLKGFLLTQILLTMSAFGTKPTCRFALHMSAFDPKRTLDSYR
jgi:hypothetical protein